MKKREREREREGGWGSRAELENHPDQLKFFFTASAGFRVRKRGILMFLTNP